VFAVEKLSTTTFACLSDQREEHQGKFNISQLTVRCTRAFVMPAKGVGMEKYTKHYCLQLELYSTVIILVLRILRILRSIST